MEEHVESTKKVILCIDDEETGLTIRKMMLESRGYVVFTAESGAKGLEVLAHSRVDAVVLDYRMPNMNGDEVARSIRTSWPDLPLVMLSGYTEDIPENALHLVDALLTKGGSPEQLFKVIEDTLGHRTCGRITIRNVDDNQQHRYAVTRVLQNAGFDVLEARTGREALAMASKCPSVVILDVNLPDMLGFEVCRELKANPITRHIPVIHVSATYPTHAAQQESIESGARVFLEQPQNLVQIVEVVQAELRRGGQIAS